MSAAVVRLDGRRVEDGLPRCDRDAEAAVLAVPLLDGEAWVRLRAILTPEDFTTAAGAAVWRAYGALADRGAPIDVVTLAGELRAARVLDAIGGPQALGDLTDTLPTLAHCEAHARIVADHAAARRLGEVGERLVAAARDLRWSPLALRERARRELEAVPIHLGDLPGRVSADVGAILDRLASLADGAPSDLLATGMRDLDTALGGGLGPGWYVALGSRPGVGKTQLACQWAVHAAEHYRGRGTALVCSLEMPRAEVSTRIVALVARVSHHALRTGQGLSPDDFARLDHAARSIEDLPLSIEDFATGDPPTLDALAARAQAVQRAQGLSILVVDHIGLVAAGQRRKDRREELVETSKGLKRLAKTLGVPVVVIAHVNRGVAQGAHFRRPRAEDLADTDQINRDADIVALLHSEWHHPTKAYGESERAQHRNRVELLIPKLRAIGGSALVSLRYVPEEGRVVECPGATTDLHDPREVSNDDW